ncbi:protein Red, partial [Nephila pilipes]
IKENVQEYGNESPSDEVLHDTGKEETEDLSVSTVALVALVSTESGNKNVTQRYIYTNKDRKDGVIPDYHNDDIITSAAGCCAVSPDAKSGLDTAERRCQIIQESKFSGGDMEHTYLLSERLRLCSITK